MRTTWNFFSAGQLEFGPGSVAGLGRQVLRRGWRKVFVVADKNLAKAGLVEKAAAPLREAGVELAIFDGGMAEPTVAVAEEAAAKAKAFGPQAVLGLGGGSNMDLAKIVAILVTHGGPPNKYFGFDNVPGPVLPIVCVPTTAGTGSEVSHAAVLTDSTQHLKVSTLSNLLRPAVAVVDPELTYSCPQKVAADSGIDALTHAIEALTAADHSTYDTPPGGQQAYDGAHPLGGCLAERAIELIGRHLVPAVQESGNHAAKDGMSLAATIAGLAFSNCAVAVVHALEYPIGGVVHCSHGEGNGLLLPYVMRFNLPTRVREFARIAGLLGEETAGLSEQAAAERAIAAVERLRRDIGIPLQLRALGLKESQLPELAAKSFAIKRLMDTNPRKPTEADLLAILRDAF